MLTVKVDLREFEKVIKQNTVDFKKVKGARAGFIKNKAYPDGTSVIDVAIKNEYGDGKIPPRPFLRNAIKKNEKKWIRYFEENFDFNQESPADLESIMQTIAEMMKADIVRSIDENLPPPNSPATIKKKGSSHTLIDTGHMRQSVQSEVITE